MLWFATRKAQAGQARLPFALYARNDKQEPVQRWLTPQSPPANSSRHPRRPGDPPQRRRIQSRLRLSSRRCPVASRVKSAPVFANARALSRQASAFRPLRPEPLALSAAGASDHESRERPSRAGHLICGGLGKPNSVSFPSPPQLSTLNLSVHHLAQTLSNRSRSATGLTIAISSRISSLAVLCPLVSSFGMAECSAWRKSSRPGWK